jgi:hypothetical protein
VKSKILGVLLVLGLCLTMVLPVSAENSVTLAGGVYDSILELENKDTSWEVLVDGVSGTLGYNNSGEEFAWGLEATGLTDGDYALIYYADFSDRFISWGGNNPGAVIAVVTSVGGVVSASGSIELNMDMPCPPDANQFEHNYSVPPDSYEHANGAKIWLVPISTLTGGNLPLATWAPTNDWLFETDLISYDDTGIVSSIVSVSVSPTSINFGILVPGQTGIGGDVIIGNTGNVPITIEASVEGAVFQNLLLDGQSVASYSASLPIHGEATIAVTLPIPTDYVPQGAETGTLTFEVFVE